MTTPPPLGDPAWEQIRLRYEQNVERVSDIAAATGMTVRELIKMAKQLGWKMRSAARKAKTNWHKAVAAAPLKKETTRATLLRLKEMLQQRVQRLEAELRDIGKEVDALNTERQMKSVNMVVRTLEKVLDLEREDKLKRQRAARDYKYFDDEQRRALAEKIERLEAQPDNAEGVAGAADGGRGGAEQPVALLGEARPTAADRR